MSIVGAGGPVASGVHHPRPGAAPASPTASTASVVSREDVASVATADETVTSPQIHCHFVTLGGSSVEGKGERVQKQQAALGTAFTKLKGELAEVGGPSEECKCRFDFGTQTVHYYDASGDAQSMDLEQYLQHNPELKAAYDELQRVTLDVLQLDPKHLLVHAREADGPLPLAFQRATAAEQALPSKKDDQAAMNYAMDLYEKHLATQVDPETDDALTLDVLEGKKEVALGNILQVGLQLHALERQVEGKRDGVNARLEALRQVEMRAENDLSAPQDSAGNAWTEATRKSQHALIDGYHKTIKNIEQNELRPLEVQLAQVRGVDRVALFTAAAFAEHLDDAENPVAVARERAETVRTCVAADLDERLETVIPHKDVDKWRIRRLGEEKLGIETEEQKMREQHKPSFAGEVGALMLYCLPAPTAKGEYVRFLHQQEGGVKKSTLEEDLMRRLVTGQGSAAFEARCEEWGGVEMPVSAAAAPTTRQEVMTALKAFDNDEDEYKTAVSETASERAEREALGGGSPPPSVRSFSSSEED